MEPLHTENRVARSKNPFSFTFLSDQRVYVTVLGNFQFLIYKKKKKKRKEKKSALFQSYSETWAKSNDEFSNSFEGFDVFFFFQLQTKNE